MASVSNTYILKPYTGVGSGVLAHGTVLKEDYKGPNSIAGHLDISGVWILEAR